MSNLKAVCMAMVLCALPFSLAQAEETTGSVGDTFKNAERYMPPSPIQATSIECIETPSDCLGAWFEGTITLYSVRHSNGGSGGADTTTETTDFTGFGDEENSGDFSLGL